MSYLAMQSDTINFVYVKLCYSQCILNLFRTQFAFAVGLSFHVLLGMSFFAR